ncbi:putative NADH-flavin reductase [Kitasatospora sp. MAP12-15]|uniref:NAD(P)-dependent oxidoreductase n=1 Tax=unclassified Kitasatospora TaxID=2633591 RepID=UPI002476BC40|nr:NAD(P)H-binding protein [Kitasatospora sp. MAP12-44]MDH6114704.1 putative NADH-flavin reductase [Kitasatospora sp. MAP12-44]
MRLTVVAATGGIGRQLLEQALAAGHEVTAVVRSPHKLPPTRARVVTADLNDADPAALRGAIVGADAVLSGLGPRSKSEAGVAWQGTTAVIAAMREAGVRRLVVVSAAPVGTVRSPGRPHPPRHDPGDGFVLRHLAYPLLKAALREHYADVAHMEDALRDSGLDWTAVRPVRLTDKPLTGHYRTARGRNLRHGLVISRADVAHCMLAALERPDTVGQTVGVAR